MWGGLVLNFLPNFSLKITNPPCYPTGMENTIGTPVSFLLVEKKDLGNIVFKEAKGGRGKVKYLIPPHCCSFTVTDSLSHLLFH